MSSADTTAAPAAVEEVPRDEAREEMLAVLRAELGDAVVGSHIMPGHELWVRVTRDAWADAATAAKRKLGCSFFDFLSAIDWLPSPFGRDMDSQVDLAVHGTEAKDPVPMTTGVAGGDTRFQLLARVVSTRSHHGVVLKADLPDDDLSAPTWVGVYLGANWHERETAEMFGITFTGHPQPGHLYLPADFEGFPLRKDFPLLSRRVKPWPGIVDVEPMPGEATEGADGEAAADGGDA